jgi:hypothetical protein
MCRKLSQPDPEEEEKGTKKKPKIETEDVDPASPGKRKSDIGLMDQELNHLESDAKRLRELKGKIEQK